MNIEKGLKLEFRKVFIDWGINIEELSKVLNLKRKENQNNIYIKNESCLKGLKCNVGFHFNESKKLNWITLNRHESIEINESYGIFQKKLESLFGKPDFIENGTEGYDINKWNIKDVYIINSVSDRFGPVHGIGIIKKY